MSRFEDLNVIERQNIYNTRLWKLGNQKARISGQLPVGEGEFSADAFVSLVQKSTASLKTFVDSFVMTPGILPPTLSVTPLVFGRLSQIYENNVNNLSDVTKKLGDIISSAKEVTRPDNVKIIKALKGLDAVIRAFDRRFPRGIGINPTVIGVQSAGTIALMIDDMVDKTGVIDDLIDEYIEGIAKPLGLGGGYAVPGYSSQDSSIPRKYL
jgi:hypothetical protein